MPRLPSGRHVALSADYVLALARKGDLHTSWEASAAGDLSKNVKHCSTDPDYLQEWAEENGIDVAYCSDCLEGGDKDEEEGRGLNWFRR